MVRQYGLSQEELSKFETDGFIGPFDAFLKPDEVAELRDYFEEVMTNRPDHPLYGRFSVRDYHLVNPQVKALFTNPAIVDRLASLAGENLALWRSKLFYKPAGGGELGWHQDWGYFNGEEIGNDKPSLLPMSMDHGWDLAVWMALDDIAFDNGPLRFTRGSHKKRYPIEMVPMPKSAFFHDPFIGVDDPAEIVELARRSRLVLDVDTSRLFDGVDTNTLTIEGTRRIVQERLSRQKAAITLPFDCDPSDIVTVLPKAGEFVIFTERTMHGSLPNTSARSRIAINCRVTTTDTLIYPGRLRGDFIDGSNVDISRHNCILLSGRDLNGRNVYGPTVAIETPEALLRDQRREAVA
jgi:non-heme Fe2+,alpha-ketoglutarate-dependent halogenase